MTELQEARSQFEAEWRRLRTSIENEVGLSRRWSWGWAATVTSLAAGVALGYALNRRRRSGARERKRLG